MKIGYFVLLAALFMSSLCVRCSAQQDWFDMTSGNWKVGFNRGSEGISATYNGVRIIRNSSFWVHNPAWNYHYYGYNQIKGPIAVRDINDGREAAISLRNENLEGLLQITIQANSLIIRTKYKLLKDIKDADLEYCLGTFSASPIIGKLFTAVDVDNKVHSGTIAVHTAAGDPNDSKIIPNDFKSLQIDSRVGRMSIESTGNPAGLHIMDYRRSVWEPADAVPVFWSGLNLNLEFGKEYDQTITISIASDSTKNIPPASAEPADAEVKTVSRLREPYYDPVYIIPEPQKMKLTADKFILSPKTQIVVGDNAKTEDLYGAQSFADEVNLLYGFKPNIVYESYAGSGPKILVGESASNALLRQECKKRLLQAPEKEEGYALKVAGEYVLALGYDRRGSYYAMQTLKQLVRSDGRNVFISGCVISDWPSLKFRGLHLFTGRDALPFHKKLYDRILSRFKMNQLVLEVDFLKWNTDPGLAVSWAQDQSEITEEIKYAKSRFIEINPLLQSLGHCDWLFTNGKNRDIAENPDIPYAYCPTNPRTYDYVFKFYDETLRLFNNPRFVHIGHDEVIEPAGFPRHEECKKRSAEQIFVDDTLKVREHIAKSGSRIMMWGDMLLAQGDSPDACNAKDRETAKWMRDQLPKDVMVSDWHYAVDKPENYKSIKIFMDEGHDTLAATWYTPQNIEAFSKQAKNVGAMGLLQTTWAGFESSENNIRDSYIQFSAVVLAAEYAWNNGRTPLDKLPYNWDAEFHKQWNPRPVKPKGERGFTLDLSRLCNVKLVDNGDGWLGLGRRYDLSSLSGGDVRLKGDLFKISSGAVRLSGLLDDKSVYPASVEINVNQKLNTLLFLHTCAWNEATGKSVGAYKIRYTDGSEETVNLIYGTNILSWTDRRAIFGVDRVWDGFNKAGQKVSLQRLQWNNPHPDRQIASVLFCSENTEASPVLVSISAIQ